MSKWSDEFEQQFKTTRKVRKEKDALEEMRKKAGKYSKEKYWIHRENKWGLKTKI